MKSSTMVCPDDDLSPIHAVTAVSPSERALEELDAVAHLDDVHSVLVREVGPGRCTDSEKSTDSSVS